MPSNYGMWKSITWINLIPDSLPINSWQEQCSYLKKSSTFASPNETSTANPPYSLPAVVLFRCLALHSGPWRPLLAHVSHRFGPQHEHLGPDCALLPLFSWLRALQRRPGHLTAPMAILSSKLTCCPLSNIPNLAIPSDSSGCMYTARGWCKHTHT